MLKKNQKQANVNFHTQILLIKKYIFEIFKKYNIFKSLLYNIQYDQSYTLIQISKINSNMVGMSTTILNKNKRIILATGERKHAHTQNQVFDNTRV